MLAPVPPLIRESKYPHQSTTGPRIHRHSPNKSHDRNLKKVPFSKMPSFFRTNSTFFGSLITTPGGSEGTEISKVSNPKWRSHFTNHENSLWRACKNRNPFPTKGSVLGGRLKLY